MQHDVSNEESLRAELDGARARIADLEAQVKRAPGNRVHSDAFRYCSHGIAIGEPSTNRILTCNPAFARMHGLTVAEVEGAPILEMHVPEEHEKVVALLRQADLKGFVSYESRMARRDGSTFPVQMDIVSVADPEEGVTYRIATMIDITERWDAQMALTESEVRFRSAVESAPEGIFIQTGGRFAYLNPAALRMFGATMPGELVGSPVIDSVHPDFRKIVSERIRKLNKALLPVPQIEEKMLRVDGTGFDAEITAVPFVYAHKHGAIAFVTDITGLKLAEQERISLEKQLFQSQKLESIGRLAGGVSHDLNNLLTPILGYSELLALKFPAEDPRRKHLDMMRDAALKARELIRQLLAFSSSQALEFRGLDLSEVVRKFSALLRRTIRANVEISYRLADGALPMIGDVGQIEQIIMNLTINADDSIASAGELRIETSETAVGAGEERMFEGMAAGSYVTLTVTDTGAGMESETLSKVFEPFFTTKPKGKGTGLGLSTVYGIVKQHGGYIRVSSEPGKGSCFSISFPKRPAWEFGGVDTENVSSSSGRCSGVVLVVEDDLLVRRFVVQALQQEGFEVCAAESGEEAFELLEVKNCVPDLLLTDLMMKGINGRELFEKAREVLPGLKVLYMSGYSKNIISNQDISSREVLFMQKPFTLSILLDKVQEALKS